MYVFNLSLYQKWFFAGKIISYTAKKTFLFVQKHSFSYKNIPICTLKNPSLVIFTPFLRIIFAYFI